MRKNFFHIVCLLPLMGVLSCASPAPEAETTVTSEQRLLLSSEGAKAIVEKAETSELVADALDRLKQQTASILESEIDVPMPKDPGGGYTHEQHKANYRDAYLCGTRYLIDGDAAALERCKELLLLYAELYPELPLHPQQKKQAPGKLFWQVLNEEVALVHFIQAYDAIRGALNPAEQEQIENGLIRPMVTFIRDDSRETFDKIHNHAMWAVAGVGMSGFVLSDPELVEQALRGSNKSGNSGFFAQINSLFSPDGYYAEGPYYQRYALMPLVLFAHAIEKNRPELEVFAFRDSVIVNAIRATAQLSGCDGHFFPLNDAIRSKTIETPELGYALPLWYAYGGKNPGLIDLMATNGNLMLTDALMDLDAAEGQPFQRESMVLRDGPNGDMGGLAVLRENETCDGLTAVMKYGSHGMGHGHFDKLEVLVYDRGHEILSDYGAARFLNIPQKEGGRYLPENKTWAKHTIAHNTLVVDETSQHSGKVKIADRSHPWQVYSQLDQDIRAVSAADTTAWPGVLLQRVLALVHIEELGSLILDVNRATSENEHHYDLPFHYRGQRIAMTPAGQMATAELRPMGEGQGYQHLWQNGTSEASDHSTFTLLNNHRFYTITSCSDQPYQVTQTTLGANDPNQNLRVQPAFIYRSKAATQTWVNVIEPHGNYDTVNEKTVQANSQIQQVSMTRDAGADACLVDLQLEDGRTVSIRIDLRAEPAAGADHKPIQIERN